MREGSRQLRRLALAAVFAAAGSIATAYAETSPACGTPTALNDGWTIASPESVGLDSERLCMIAARGSVEEAAGVRVEEAVDHRVGDLLREIEIAEIGGGLVGVETGDGGECVVVEQSGTASRRGFRVGVGDDVQQSVIGIPCFGQDDGRASAARSGEPLSSPGPWQPPGRPRRTCAFQPT